VDLVGRPYFDAHLRPIAEAAAVFGQAAESAAWLHDILEDTDVSAEHLLSMGVDPTTVEAVESVTRRVDESYKELIGRACAQPIGRLVKLADNAWNITSNPTLAAIDPEKAASMLQGRYQPARRRLLVASELTEDSPQVRTMQAVLDQHRDRLEAN
jgi:(p)ppGpp synthase/HD superfamily hydrolase